MQKHKPSKANTVQKIQKNKNKMLGQPTVLPIYLELQRRTTRRMHKVMFRAMSIAFIIYLIGGSFGYLVFLEDTCGNILVNDFKKHIEVVIGAAAMAISLTMTVPTLMICFRSDFSLLFLNGEILNTKKHFLITLIVISICCFVAVIVDNIATVFGFLGCTTNPMMGWILPAIYFVKLVPSHKAKKRKLFAYIIAILIAFLSLATIAFKIYSYADTNYQQPQCTPAAGQSI